MTALDVTILVKLCSNASFRSSPCTCEYSFNVAHHLGQKEGSIKFETTEKNSFKRNLEITAYLSSYVGFINLK